MEGRLPKNGNVRAAPDAVSPSFVSNVLQNSAARQFEEPRTQ
jgi:hypothetical protein